MVGGVQLVAKAALQRPALAGTLVNGIKVISNSKIRARQSRLDNNFSLSQAPRVGPPAACRGHGRMQGGCEGARLLATDP